LLAPLGWLILPSYAQKSALDACFLFVWFGLNLARGLVEVMGIGFLSFLLFFIYLIFNLIFWSSLWTI
jgi:hypothetical protein